MLPSSGILHGLRCFMNDVVDQFAEGNIPFQAAVIQLPPSQVIQMSLANQSNYQPLKMARLCQISLRHLERTLKVESGCTPREWLKTQRLNNALLMLRKAQSVKQVAYALAYPQIPQFCREFKIRFGITPKEFRQSQANAQDRMLTAYLGTEQDIGPRHPLRRVIRGEQVLAKPAS
jgi:AraC-like DNA-binding protein